MFFRMDRKTKILIASLLGRIEVAPEKKYGKADFLDSKLLYVLYGLVAASGRILPSTLLYLPYILKISYRWQVPCTCL